MSSSRIFGNTLSTIISVAIPGILGLWCLKPLMQLLGTANFTLLSFFWVYTAHLGFFDFGLSRTMGIELPKNEHVLKRFIIYEGLKKAGLYSIIGVIFVLLVLIFCSKLEVIYPYILSSSEIILLIIWVPLSVLQLLVRSIMEASNCFNTAAVFRAFNQSVLFITPWLMARLGSFTIVEMIGIIAILRIFSLVLSGLWVLQKYGPFIKSVSAVKMRLFEPQNKWLTLSNLSGVVNGSIDRITLLWWFGAQSIGAYVFAQDFSVRILVLSSSFALVLLPFFSGNSDKQHNHKWVLRAFGLIISSHIILGLLVAVFGPLFVKDMVNPEWSHSVIRYFLIFMVGITANGLGHVLLAALHSKDELKMPAIWHVASIGIYLPLLFWGVKEFSLLGAAIIMSLRSVFDAGVLYYFWRKCIS